MVQIPSITLCLDKEINIKAARLYPGQSDSNCSRTRNVEGGCDEALYNHIII